MGCWGGRPWRLAIKPSVLKDYYIILVCICLFFGRFLCYVLRFFVCSLHLFVWWSLTPAFACIVLILKHISVIICLL